MTPEDKLESETNDNTGTDELPGDSATEAPSSASSEAAEWRDKYLRKLAEFDNFRKRTRQESEMLGQLVAESLISGLLPVMDDFDRLLASIRNSEDPLRKGVEMVRGKLWSFFESRNVSVMDVRGKSFDPEQHDALMMRETADFPAGIVLDVITPGYAMGDKVVRHAQVIVSKEPDTDSLTEQSNPYED